jgi:hypothetical protein
MEEFNMVLRRIGVRSVIKTIFWLSVALGFVQIMLYVLYQIATGTPASHFNLDFWIRFAVRLALFGAHKALMMGILAYVYNVVSKRFGGLELEFETLEKRKNGEEDMFV